MENYGVEHILKILVQMSKMLTTEVQAVSIHPTHFHLIIELCKHTQHA